MHMRNYLRKHLITKCINKGTYYNLLYTYTIYLVLFSLCINLAFALHLPLFATNIVGFLWQIAFL